MKARVGFANVVSVLALVVAMSGGAYALSLPRHSVGKQQLKKHAVTGPKIASHAVGARQVREHSLDLGDFKDGQLMRWRGAWDSNATYAKRDVVTYQGSSWVANQTTVMPPTTPFWSLLASRGNPGAVGPRGPAGPVQQVVGAIEPNCTLTSGILGVSVAKDSTNGCTITFAGFLFTEVPTLNLTPISATAVTPSSIVEGNFGADWYAQYTFASSPPPAVNFIATQPNP